MISATSVKTLLVIMATAMLSSCLTPDNNEKLEGRWREYISPEYFHTYYIEGRTISIDHFTVGFHDSLFNEKGVVQLPYKITQRMTDYEWNGDTLLLQRQVKLIKQPNSKKTFLEDISGPLMVKLTLPEVNQSKTFIDENALSAERSHIYIGRPKPLFRENLRDSLAYTIQLDETFADKREIPDFLRNCPETVLFIDRNISPQHTLALLTEIRSSYPKIKIYLAHSDKENLKIVFELLEVH